MAKTYSLIAVCEKEFGFVPHPKQRELLERLELQPNAVWAVGRRGGKSKCSAAVALFDLLFRPDLDELIEPGGERVSVVVATSRKQATIPLNEGRRFVRHSPVATACLVSETNEELIFEHNARRKIFRAAACSSRTLRGPAYSTGVMDEAAFAFEGDPDADGAISEIYKSVHGGTAEFGSRARILIISSPRDDRNWFARRWQWANGDEDPSWWAAQVSTMEMNPSVDRDFLATVQRTQPEIYPSEYDAQFISGGTNMFDRTRFALEPSLSTAELGEAERWACGLDPAISGDAFGVSFLGLTAAGQFVLGPCQAMTHGFDGSWTAERKRDAWQEVLAKVANVCRQYDAEVFSDQHESQVVAEMLSRYGIESTVISMNGRPRDEYDQPMEAAGNVKYTAFVELRDALYSGKLRLPTHTDLFTELMNVQLKIDSTGPRVILPRSSKGHCDLAQSLALACYALTRRGSVAPVAVPTLTPPNPYSQFGQFG